MRKSKELQSLAKPVDQVRDGRLVSGADEVKGLILILTAQCNSRCSYCYQTAKKSLSMDWATLRASLDLALHSGSKEVKLAFLGGEPLLEFPKIRKAVRYVGDNAPPGKRIRYAVATNGTLITDRIADFLDKHGFELQLSFDGIAKAQNYRRKGTFVVIDRLLDSLRKRQPDLFLNRTRLLATLIPATVPYLAESIRYLMKKGVPDITIFPSFTFSPGWTNEGMQELDAQFSRIYDDSLRQFVKTGEVPLSLFRKKKNGRHRRIARGDMCSLMTRKTLVVDVDGQVYGCVTFVESYQEFPSRFLETRLAPLKMGALRDPGFWKRYAAFPEAARKAEFFDHKEKKYSSYRKCGECEHIDSCFVCPASIGYDPANTDPHRIPDFACAFNLVAQKYRSRFPSMTRTPELLDELLVTKEQVTASSRGAGPRSKGSS